MTRRRLRPARQALLAAVFVAAQSAHAQQLGGGQAFEFPLGRLALGLVLSALIAFVAVFLLRRHSGHRPLFHFLQRSGEIRDRARQIRVIETQRLSPHADVCRFVSADTEYLVVVSASGATVLREVRAQQSEPDAKAGPRA
jgi:hypothetical protein